MDIVDAHCHASPCWYEPVESLLYQMDHNCVERAVLVQIRGQTDNEYLFECVRRYPDRFVPVVLLDPARPGAERELERLAGRGARGVRLEATARSPGDHPQDHRGDHPEDDRLAIWRKAAQLGLPVSTRGSSADYAAHEFAQVVQAVPELTIVMEHLGSGNYPQGDVAPYETRRRAFSLARFPNVYVKIGGLGEFCTRAMPVREPFPFEEPIPPFIEMAYRAFGPERMMWGSDFPPVSPRGIRQDRIKYELGDKYMDVEFIDEIALVSVDPDLGQ
jgi:L-fuconolactonase